MTRSAHGPTRRTVRAHAFVSAFIALLILTIGLAELGRAAEKGQTITLGESLSDAQRTQMLDLFKASPDDKVITITMSDTLEAMAGISMEGNITSAFSSTALRCRKLGEGLDVTTSNINLVTPDLYAIALVTAGIGDATLIVAAPVEAPARGMTALAGIFKTWDIAPCASGDTSKERQQLALQELAIATAIGEYLVAVGVPDGVQRSGNVVLETQKTIVTEKLTKQADIDAAIAAQEQTQGIIIPPDLRAQLLDMMTRLAAQKIDWSTFSAGWTIKRPHATRITMTGDGIAIRNARRTATAEARAAKTATAEAAANLTATAEADSRNATATAQAELDMTATANAQATQQAQADMTATALAIPTATPEPVGASGKIVATRAREIVVEQGTVRTPYTLAANVTVVRGGKSAKSDALQKGDTVQLTLDGSTREVIAVTAQPAPGSWTNKLPLFGGVLLMGSALCGMVVVRRRRDEPFIVTIGPA